jgi:hypothetical protein
VRALSVDEGCLDAMNLKLHAICRAIYFFHTLICIASRGSCSILSRRLSREDGIDHGPMTTFQKTFR